MDKQIVVYLYNGVLLSNTKKWIIDIYNNMDEGRPKKEYILHDSIYIKF